MPDLDWPALATPLGEAEPCGQNLELDEQFSALLKAAEGEPEIEIGSPGEPGYQRREAKGPNWRAVREAALTLAARTRDVRVAVWLARSGAHGQGLSGVVQGLQLLAALLQRHWDTVHPQVDPARPGSRIAQLNAIGDLVHPQGGLPDLRSARIGPQRTALTLREIELGLGAAKPLSGEPLPTREGVLAGVAKALKEDPVLATVMSEGVEAARAIEAVFAARLPPDQRPNLEPLCALMNCLAEAAVGQPAGREGPTVPGGPIDGAIASRDDAIRALERVCAWIEQNEPASPAPIFIRRSQQLLKKSFIDIIRDLLPDNVKQIEHFAGKSHP